MINKWVVAVVLFLMAFNVSALTIKDAKEVYSKLIVKNHLIHTPRLTIWPISDVNAYCDNESNTIAITPGMLKFVKNRDELAIVLGHELGHCILHHSTSTPNNEYIADRMGYLLAQHANYNVCVGVNVFKEFNDPGGDTHPPSINRYNLLKCK